MECLNVSLYNALEKMECLINPENLECSPVFIKTKDKTDRKKP